MQKKNLLVFIFSAFLILLNPSCTKDELGNFNKKVNFDISARLLEGSSISCIDIDNRGNYCIGSGNELYCDINGKKETIKLGYKVLAAAIAPDETIWVGTDGGGLGHILSASKIEWYKVSNAGLPRDNIRDVEIAPNGNVWFSSCAHQIGGLGVFDGNEFSFFTPENSPLNQNVIWNISIDRDGVVYIATSGTVGRSVIFRIKDKKWECLGEEGMFYWISSFTVTPAGTIYAIEDFSLSSLCCQSNNLHEFNRNKWRKIETDGITISGLFSKVKADQRGYLWIPGYDNDTPNLHVYTGDSWISSPAGIFPGDLFTCMEVDNDNNIWLGTYSNGVFKINQ
jgi:ligand-binding sensor domain-containing protein